MNGFSPDLLAIPGLILILATSLGLFLVQGAVWSVALLAIQYVGVFALVSLQWPFPMALSTLMAGWIAAFILGFAIYSLQERRHLPVQSPEEEKEDCRDRIRLWHNDLGAHLPLVGRYPGYFGSAFCYADCPGMGAWYRISTGSWGARFDWIGIIAAELNQSPHPGHHWVADHYLGI